jgi:hypothetical protein
MVHRQFTANNSPRTIHRKGNSPQGNSPQSKFTAGQFTAGQFTAGQFTANNSPQFF